MKPRTTRMYVAHLPHEPGEQVLPILWKKIDEDGPPGLIIARYEFCDEQHDEQLVSDLGCLSDSTGVNVLLVTATEQPSLDVSVSLRGDIQASAIVPKLVLFWRLFRSGLSRLGSCRAISRTP